MYPTDCLCGVITRSYLPSLIKQLFFMIVGLFPKLSLDIRFRMMGAKFGLVILMSKTVSYYDFCVYLNLGRIFGLMRKA